MKGTNMIHLMSSLPLAFFLSSVAAAALPSRLTCTESKSSQVCADRSAICTAPPKPSPTTLGETQLTESAETDAIYRHGRLEAKASRGFAVTAEGSVEIPTDAVGKAHPRQSIALFVRETRGTTVRTIRLSGETAVEFRYSESTRSQSGHESVDVSITCSLK